MAGMEFRIHNDSKFYDVCAVIIAGKKAVKDFIIPYLHFSLHRTKSASIEMLNAILQLAAICNSLQGNDTWWTTRMHIEQEVGGITCRNASL